MSQRAAAADAEGFAVRSAAVRRRDVGGYNVGCHKVFLFVSYLRGDAVAVRRAVAEYNAAVAFRDAVAECVHILNFGCENFSLFHFVILFAFSFYLLYNLWRGVSNVLEFHGEV